MQLWPLRRPGVRMLSHGAFFRFSWPGIPATNLADPATFAKAQNS